MKASSKRDLEGGNEHKDQIMSVKREKVDLVDRGETGDGDFTQDTRQGIADRRALRSKYLAVRNKINDDKDELSKPDSDKFDAMMNEVANLHRQVQKPREQVADAEALLDLTNTLLISVKSHSVEGITSSEFVTCLLAQFGQSNRIISSEENTQNLIKWKDIGLLVSLSPAFRRSYGCCTMLGPMDTELKQRKVVVRRKRRRVTAKRARPEEVGEKGAVEKIETAKNILTMFEILRRQKCVRLESLILNRRSFAHTVENLFALSFLVKDGRVEISIDEKGCHLVSPKNAPCANMVVSGEVIYSHFAFRYDFKDWKVMVDVIPQGEELMPYRDRVHHNFCDESAAPNIGAMIPVTETKNLARNRCVLLQDESVGDYSTEFDKGSFQQEYSK